MPQKRPIRKRGVVLTNIGLQKLQSAKRKAEIWENEGDRYTFEELSYRTGLSPITVAKVLNRETGADKQSLLVCFSAFGLILTEEDYTKPTDRSLQTNRGTNNPAAAPKPDAIEGWMVSGSHPNDYDIRLDSTLAYQGQRSALIQSKSPQIGGFGTLMQVFKANRYRGQRLKMSGYVKTEAVETWAGLWMRVDGPEHQILSFDNMQNRSITGTTAWTQYVVVLDVPAAAERIAFGVLLAGAGRVWCDRIQFEPVGLEIPTTAPDADQQIPNEPLNLDFEQQTPEARSPE